MRLFQDKREQRRKLFSGLSLFVILVAMFVLFKGIVNIYPKYELANESRRTLELEERVLDSRRNQLENDLSKLSSKTGAEAELRSKYQVSRPGEEVIVIIGETESPHKQKSDYTDNNYARSAFDYIKSLFQR